MASFEHFEGKDLIHPCDCDKLYDYESLYKNIMMLSTLIVLYFLCRLNRRIFTFSVQINGTLEGCSQENVVYHSLLTWLSKNVDCFQVEKLAVDNSDPNYLHKAELAKSVGLNSPEEEFDTETDHYKENENRLAPEQREWKLKHTAGYGTHYFQYKGAWIKLERAIRPGVIVYKNTQELITLTTAFWNKTLIRQLLEDAKPTPKKSSERRLRIYRVCPIGGYWTSVGTPKRKRPLDSVILEKNMSQGLINDVKEFLSLENWYVERGIPYRRGYLLYGPPGCGKSSIIKSIAGELGYDICILSLSQKICDDSLTDMLNRAPTKSIMLLEDIDAAFKSREDQLETSSREVNLAFDGCSQSALTFRGLLNALDGVGSAEGGQIIFMTTNYPEKLDPALIRPGRVDLKIFIDYPSEFQLEGMFKKFYPKADNALRRKFVSMIKNLDLKISMAMIQGLFLIHKNSAEDALDDLKSYFENQYSKSKEILHALYC